jgi:tetratricopeptide (TPR) repeat protein
MAGNLLWRHALAINTIGWLMVAHPAGALPQDSSVVAADGPSTAAALRATGLDLGYNLDHEEALAAFRAAIAADQTHPAAYRLAAATIWIEALFRQGAVTADDYLGQAHSDASRKPLPPELAASFQAHIDRALALGEQRLRAHPDDPDAHFQVGAAYAFLTTYKTTIEGRLLGGLRTARRAYNEHERVLELDPHRTDAALTVGMYRYGVSTLSAPLRLLAGLAGFGGGRARGLALVEEAAAHPSDVQANALFTLIVIYNREARYDEALRVIHRLQALYPRNRLLALEAATTALRAGRFDEARTAVEEGLDRLSRDRRPRAFGEEARWRYCHGAALVGLHQIDRAERELRKVLEAPAADWVRGRAHKELGKLADLAGDRSRAVSEYRLATRLCDQQHDAICSNEASGLVKARYR